MVAAILVQQNKKLYFFVMLLVGIKNTCVSYFEGSIRL